MNKVIADKIVRMRVIQDEYHDYMYFQEKKYPKWKKILLEKYDRINGVYNIGIFNNEDPMTVDEFKAKHGHRYTVIKKNGENDYFIKNKPFVYITFVDGSSSCIYRRNKKECEKYINNIISEHNLDAIDLSKYSE